MRALTVLAACLVSGCPERAPATNAEPTRATVIEVMDGDSLKVQVDGRTLEVRLHGIDAPEYDQPYGKAARAALVELTAGQDLALTVLTTDRYDRAVARLVRQADDSHDVNLAMIEGGHAWVYGRHENDPAWLAAEAAARAARRGLWRRDRPTPPWDWRHKKD